MLTQRTAQEQRNYARGVQAYLSGQASPDADACGGWGDAKRAAECTPRPEFLAWANAQLDAARHQITEQQRRTLHAVGHTLYGAGWADKRHALALAVTHGRTQSSTELTEAEAQQLIDGMRAKQAAQRPTPQPVYAHFSYR